MFQLMVLLFIVAGTYTNYKTECSSHHAENTFLCMRLNQLRGLTPQMTGMDDRYGDEKSDRRQNMSGKETEKDEKKGLWFTFGNVRVVINKEAEGWTNIAFFFPDGEIKTTKIGKSVRFGVPDKILPRFIDALGGTSTEVQAEAPKELDETDKKLIELGKKIIELVKTSSVLD